ncbi:DUF2207 domain-containing protein [Kribbella shirazensis]|uniref:Putative membrane protein YgcG n=1 Tax=Kribbella shirazensis TaxID=1105143 RepID=A0A7X5VEQ8_9ACTN|nr:DUF2207 domain-containing protein [Kribbella shirazensis]NIK59880.1 putative membrane protein YgcG [Kribbella shirazensis]
MPRGIRIVVSTLFAVVALAGAAVPTTAADGDEITDFAIEYTVSEDGVLHVEETIDYTFGSSGRHGIYRDLVVREPYKDDISKDQKYEVSNISVWSPDASDAWTSETTKRNDGRDAVLRIKIGSENRTIYSEDAKYVIKYDVRGALRHFGDHTELYWDATGSDWDATIKKVTVQVTVPQGVQRVDCYSGLAGSTTPCESKSLTAGQAHFGASRLLRQEQLTVVAGIKAGAVRNDTPIVVDPPGAIERAGLSWLGIAVSVLVTAGAAGLGVLHHRKAGRDQRYADLPPGTAPPEGATARIGKDGLTTDQIPVVFAPPRIPVAEGGLLIDGRATNREVAATMIDLAVRGALRIENSGDGPRKAVLVAPAVATEPHEEALLKGLFPELQPGDERLLQAAAIGDYSLVRGAEATIAAVQKQVRARNWYVRMPHAAGGTEGDMSFAFGWLIAIAIVVVGIGVAQIGSGPFTSGRFLVIAGPVVALLVLVWSWVSKQRQGRRTAAGRAVTDQVAGFRTYLATAEAEQLRFEEGEDIFSKYLPWAIVFGLAERWQRVCGELVRAGRLTAEPDWYAGPSYYTSEWTAASFSSTVASTFAEPPPPPRDPSSGDGGGSSSGFSSSSSYSSSDSGSSGGGGGGGGGGSW